MFSRLPCVAEIICKISQSNVLQRECELMLLRQEMEELEESLESQVHQSTSVAALCLCIDSPTAGTGCGSQFGR